MQKLDVFKNNHILEYVKSQFIKKEIFSFLKEKQKLNILLYNKQLQKFFGFDIEKYKIISKRYKIGEKNGFGKLYELNTNILIFEGEYLNNKINGKGKEYIHGKLIFEGEYLNGVRNGKGKEYIDDKLIFEGEYSNGVRNGSGKEYYFNGKLIFEGEYLNGKKWNRKGYNNKGDLKFDIENGNGKGKIYDYEGFLIFEGEYLNGEKHGKGKDYFFNNNM